MSETVNSGSEPRVVDADPARPLKGPFPVDRADHARETGYRKRFGLIYVALAVLAGIGVGALVVLLAKPEAAPDPVWSVWKPDGSSDARVKQIADHVAGRYRLSSGDQIAVALAGPPTVAAGGTEGQGNIPVRAIAVRPDTSTGKAEEDDIEIINAGTSLQYVLCGLGQNCSITAGKPSEARHALLRRQALELALYTFKYVDGVDTITVFLPPRPDGAAPPNAVFLKRSDVAPELKRPLTKTLAPTAPGIGSMPQHELSAVNRITRPHLYGYEYTQAQDGSAVLVLNPIVA
jgi:hypothetical protein